MDRFPIAPSRTQEVPLADLVARLSAHSDIDGSLLMGSAAAGTLHPASDYDLAVAARTPALPLLGITTCVDHRFAELFFYSLDELTKLLNAQFTSVESRLGWLLNWLRGGRILLDHTGMLTQLQAKAQCQGWTKFRMQPRTGPGTS